MKGGDCMPVLLSAASGITWDAVQGAMSNLMGVMNTMIDAIAANPLLLVYAVAPLAGVALTVWTKLRNA